MFQNIQKFIVDPKDNYLNGEKEKYRRNFEKIGGERERAKEKLI